MHEEFEENYNRGYEWWLMKEAKKRNPDIKLLGLSWTWPHWLGNDKNEPYKDLEKTAMYTVKWILGAKLVHNLTIDYIGIWNERPCDLNYIVTLKRALVGSKLDDVRIIGCDGWWDTFGPFQAHKDVADLLYAFGVHYPGATSPQAAIDSNMTLWSSEDYSTFNDEIGAGCWARVLNQNYVNGYMTSTISWNLIASYYFGLPYEGDGLMTAVEPWSGYYEVKSPIWISAHTTQFTEIGWKYLKHGHGVGSLEKGGSYVALSSPNGQQLTIVIETMIQSNRISLELGVDTIITLTTVADGKRGDAGPIPKSAPFPLPYEDDFQHYALNEEPYNLAPQIGTWEILKDATSNAFFARQMVVHQPVAWCDIQPYPIAIIGDQHWSDLNITAKVRLPSENATGVVFIGVKTAMAQNCDYFKSKGIFLHVNQKFSTYTISTDLLGLEILDVGPLKEKFEINRWYTLSLTVKNQTLMASFSNSTQISLTLPTNEVSKQGFASLGSSFYGYSDWNYLRLNLP